MALEAVRATRITAADARFAVTLAVHNPNAYDLAVNALDVELALEGEPLFAGALTAPTVTRGVAPTTRVEVAGADDARRRRARPRSPRAAHDVSATT